MTENRYFAEKYTESGELYDMHLSELEKNALAQMYKHNSNLTTELKFKIDKAEKIFLEKTF